MKNTNNKLSWKIAKILWIIVIALFSLLAIALCTAPKNKKEKEEKKLQVTPEQEKIIKEHYELYYKLSPSANNGEELDKISDEISEQMCKKYNMTRKEYDDMWDIYNFGYILED